MPSSNQQKDYQPNSYYHLYNRGVNKMRIFHQDQDYAVFLHYLKLIFAPLDILWEELRETKNSSLLDPGAEAKIRRLQNAVLKAKTMRIFEDVELLGYCLMPNHFHLLIYQTAEDGIIKLMRRLGSGFSTFYRNKYNHQGHIFQGRYHASWLSYEPKLQALYAARYIETNPLDLPVQRPKTKNSSSFYPYSSLQWYVAEERESRFRDSAGSPVWLKTDRLLEVFDEIRKKPNGFLEQQTAIYDSYTDFILGRDDINLEDVRLTHLRELLS